MKNALWIDFNKYKPLKKGRYLVIYYGEIDTAYWAGEYFNTKWVLDQDDEPTEIVYNETSVSFWAELPNKPTCSPH